MPVKEEENYLKKADEANKKDEYTVHHHLLTTFDL